MLTLGKGTVEEYGIPASAVEKLEELFSKRGVRIHGYMLLGGRKILRERYFGPYTKADNHRMYSITKSFVALATGLLEKNGLITLEDKICDYFPEKLPGDGVHPWCGEMTIRDLLTMRTCYESTTYKCYDGDDWTESFFRVKPDHVPGTVFSYDTSAAHVLGALVEKLTGMKLLDYMRKEMLNEIGFSKGAYIIPDPVGVSQGGSGLMCTLTDVAVVAYLCNHYGVVDGKELLPVRFVRDAVSNLVPTYLQPKLDEQLGYGYYIWMTREEGYVFFGMGGQLAVCFPKYDFCYLTMADTIGSPAGLQILYDCFYETIHPFLKERREDNPLAFAEDGDVGACSTKKTQKEESAPERQICEKTRGRLYRFYPNAMGWNSVSFDWEERLVQFAVPAGNFTLKFGKDTWEKQSFLNTGYVCECRGMWMMGHFFLECFLIDEEQGNVRMEFAWKDHRLTLHSVSTNEPFFEKLYPYFNGFASAEC